MTDAYAHPLHDRAKQIAALLWSPPHSEPMPPVWDSALGDCTAPDLGRAYRAIQLCLPDHRVAVEECLVHGDHALVRLVGWGSHVRDGAIGPATQTQKTYRLAVMIDGLTTPNSAVVLRDQRALGTGTAPTHANHTCPAPHKAVTDLWVRTYCDVLSAMMDGDFSVFRRGYSRTCAVHMPGGVLRIGADSAERFWLSLRAALPSARFEIVTGFEDHPPLSPPRVGVLWRLTGSHDGWGAFGAPSGSKLALTGISFAEFSTAGVQSEWTILDTAAVDAQIAQAQTPLSKIA